MLFELAILVQRDPDLRRTARAERTSSAKALKLFERLERDVGCEFVGNRQAIADLTFATLDGLAASWLSHRDGQRTRDALTTFALTLASMTQPAGGG